MFDADTCVSLKVPITRAVINDLPEALKRIKNVRFEDDRIVIELIADNISVRGSILILDIIVIGATDKGDYFTNKIVLTDEFKQKFVDWDYNQKAIIIPIPGAQQIIFVDGADSQSFKKNKSDHSK